MEWRHTFLKIHFLATSKCKNLKDVGYKKLTHKSHLIVYEYDSTIPMTQLDTVFKEENMRINLLHSHD